MCVCVEWLGLDHKERSVILSIPGRAVIETSAGLLVKCELEGRVCV